MPGQPERLCYLKSSSRVTLASADRYGRAWRDYEWIFWDRRPVLCRPEREKAAMSLWKESDFRECCHLEEEYPSHSMCRFEWGAPKCGAVWASRKGLLTWGHLYSISGEMIFFSLLGSSWAVLFIIVALYNMSATNAHLTRVERDKYKICLHMLPHASPLSM